MTDDNVAEEWFLQTQTEFLTKGHLAAEISLPGSAHMSPDLPEELVAEKPRPPTLHLLTLGGPQKDYPVVPDQLNKEKRELISGWLNMFLFFMFELGLNAAVCQLISQHVRTGSSTIFTVQNGEP